MPGNELRCIYYFMVRAIIYSKLTILLDLARFSFLSDRILPIPRRSVNAGTNVGIDLIIGSIQETMFNS